MRPLASLFNKVLFSFLPSLPHSCPPHVSPPVCLPWPFPFPNLLFTSSCSPSPYRGWPFLYLLNVRTSPLPKYLVTSRSSPPLTHRGWSVDTPSSSIIEHTYDNQPPYEYTLRWTVFGVGMINDGKMCHFNIEGHQGDKKSSSSFLRALADQRHLWTSPAVGVISFNFPPAPAGRGNLPQRP